MNPQRSVVDSIFDQYLRLGHRSYGEEVTELQHALQAAMIAHLEGEEPYLIAASLLHDCGHLLHDLGEDVASGGVDAIHEIVGADFLARHFRAEVSQAVRLHVLAKRYLCQRDPSYLAQLSPASRLSLELQGGVLTAEESAAFERQPFSGAAVRLRRYDDSAKIPGIMTPGLEVYRPLLESLVVSNPGSGDEL